MSYSQLGQRIYNRARHKYPKLEFDWDNATRTLSVVGARDWGKPLPRWQLEEFRKDKAFDQYRPEVVVETIQPSSNPVPSQVESPVSSWPLPGASANIVEPVAIGPGAIQSPVTVVKNELAKSKVLASGLNIMPQRRRRRRNTRRPTVRSRRYKLQNAALRPTRRPFKQVISIALSSGYYDHEFNIKDLVPELLTVFEEIRITSLSVVFLTKDVSVVSGIYTAILLDQNGYGTPLKSTATWFQRVADMPGSVVHHAVRGFKLTWKPTEPDSRNFVKVIDTADIGKTIARVYIIGEDNKLAISGVLLIRGTCLCRGQYYDASKLTVAMMKSLRLKEIEEEETEDGAALSDCEFPSTSSTKGSRGDEERIQ